MLIQGSGVRFIAEQQRIEILTVLWAMDTFTYLSMNYDGLICFLENRKMQKWLLQIVIYEKIQSP